jgi:NOL1/NOP2/fmu family ribosome biogenesis protein
MHPDQFTQRYVVNDEEWAKYVHGDTFMIRNRTNYTNGWYLLEINGNGTGFGKLEDGQMNNFYPKGLRFLVRDDKSEELSDDMY